MTVVAVGISVDGQHRLHLFRHRSQRLAVAGTVSILGERRLQTRDIADVDIGRNIGAKLQEDQAQADKKIAQAKAEQRRAMAVAKEQEMKAYTQEMKAKVVEAEAKVPEAMAEALKQGRLGVMDYYRMNNINADTKMRQSISGVDSTEK